MHKHVDTNRKAWSLAKLWERFWCKTWSLQLKWSLLTRNWLGQTSLCSQSLTQRGITYIAYRTEYHLPWHCSINSFEHLLGRACPEPENDSERILSSRHELVTGSRSSRQNGFYYGDSLNYTCSDMHEFNANGTSVLLECKADGTWSRELPKCRGVYMPHNSPILDHGPPEIKS